MCRYLRSYFVYASMYTSSEGYGETAPCAGSPKPSLFAYAIRSYASWADLFILSVAHSYMPSSNDCCLVVIGSLVKKQTGSFLITKMIPDRLHKNLMHTQLLHDSKLKKNQCAYFIRNVHPSVCYQLPKNSRNYFFNYCFVDFFPK